METLSTWITPTAYQIVSFAWKLVQVSEGRQGEWAVAVERCNTAQALALRPIITGCFFHTGERTAEERDHCAGGHRSLGSYHLDSAPPCLLVHKQKPSQTISYLHLSPKWHAAEEPGRDDAKTKPPDFIRSFFIVGIYNMETSWWGGRY